jgi:Ner family transcriptional regulator
VTSDPHDGLRADGAGAVSATAQRPATAADWHPADIIAALTKRGHRLTSLSVRNGYHPTAVGKALRAPWPRAERIIADALGVPPEVIWPSRYNRQDDD